MWYCPDYAPPACTKEEVEGIFYRWIDRFERRIDGEFVFHDGMRFGSQHTWWGSKQKSRGSPHEGLDFCTYHSADGKYKRLLPGQEVEPVEIGEVVAHFPDFIGNTVILRHPDLTTDAGTLHSVYGHVRLVTAGDTLKLLISGSVTNAPPHLHLSLFYKQDKVAVDSWNLIHQEGLFMFSLRRKHKLSGTNIGESPEVTDIKASPKPKAPEIITTDIDGDVNFKAPTNGESTPQSTCAFSDKCLSFSDDPIHKATDWACGYLPVIELVNVSPDDVILDVGCGLGGMCYYLANRCKCKHVTGLDVSARLLRQAQEYKAEGLSFHLLDKTQNKPLEHWRKTNMSLALVDLIFCCFVLSGFQDQNIQIEFLAQMASALKPSGQCLILVNNPKYYGTRFSSIKLSKIPSLAGGVPLSSISPHSAIDSGCSSISSTPSGRGPLYIDSHRPNACDADFIDGQRVRLEMYDIGKKSDSGSGFRLVSYDRYWSQEHYVNILKSAGFKQVTPIELKYGTQFDAELIAIGISPKCLHDTDKQLAPILALRGTV